MPTRVQGLPSDTPAQLACHLTCYKGRPAPARARTNCRQVQHWAADLDSRLGEHQAGRGARLTQVQLAAGGSWRLASAEPGTRARERQLKQHSVGRRCQICKAEAHPGEPEPEPEAGL